jgi:hypothetical protein
MEIEPLKSSKKMSTVMYGCSPIQSRILFSSGDSIAIVSDLFIALHVLLVMNALVRTHAEIAIQRKTTCHADEILRLRRETIGISAALYEDYLPVGTRPTLADELQFLRLDSFVRALCHNFLLNYCTTNSNGAVATLIALLKALKD